MPQAEGQRGELKGKGALGGGTARAKALRPEVRGEGQELRGSGQDGDPRPGSMCANLDFPLGCPCTRVISHVHNRPRETKCSWESSKGPGLGGGDSGKEPRALEERR